MTTAARVQQYLGQVAEAITEHGLVIQAVVGKPVESFSYTVGRTENSLPELWIGTMHPAQAHMLLTALVDTDAHEPGFIDCGMTVRLLLRGPVDLDAAEVGVARGLYGFEPDAIEVLQVLWPDLDGVFPDAEGYDQVCFPQRLLPLATP